MGKMDGNKDTFPFAHALILSADVVLWNRNGIAERAQEQDAPKGTSLLVKIVVRVLFRQHQKRVWQTPRARDDDCVKNAGSRKNAMAML